MNGNPKNKNGNGNSKDISKYYVPIGILISAIVMTIAVMMYVGSVVSAIDTMSAKLEHHSVAIERLADEFALINDHSTSINGLEIRIAALNAQMVELQRRMGARDELLATIRDRLTFLEAKISNAEESSSLENEEIRDSELSERTADGVR